MPLSDVSISLGNGNLGRLPNSEDGIAAIVVSGVAVGGSFALGEVLGPFLSLKDAEDMGITAAYDVTNTCMAHSHIKDFYAAAGSGNQLYVMVVAKTVTLAQQAANAGVYAKTLLATALGKIRFLGLTRVPDGAYTPTYANGLDTDITAAIAALKVMHAAEFTDHRPVRFVVEGRDWQGNAGTTLDLTDTATGPNANQVMLVIGQNRDAAALHAGAAESAAVGLMLGTLAANRVHYSAARVKSGMLPIDNVGLSDGTAITAMTTTDLNALNDKSYVFIRAITGVAGKFWNSDFMACPETDDYCFMSRGRVIDKAARITYATYVTELNDDVEIGSDGKMAAAVIKNYESILETAIGTQMAGEISDVSVYIDPNQNVLANDTINVEVSIIPRGLARFITVTLAYSNPFQTT